MKKTLFASESTAYANKNQQPVVDEYAQALAESDYGRSVDKKATAHYENFLEKANLVEQLDAYLFASGRIVDPVTYGCLEAGNPDDLALYQQYKAGETTSKTAVAYRKVQLQLGEKLKDSYAGANEEQRHEFEDAIVQRDYHYRVALDEASNGLAFHRGEFGDLWHENAIETIMDWKGYTEDQARMQIKLNLDYAERNWRRLSASMRGMNIIKQELNLKESFREML